MRQIELPLILVFTAVWLLAIVSLLGWLPVAGVLELDLYRYYSVAAVLGWLTGNIYVSRARGLPRGRFRYLLALAYLGGPSSFLFALRALAPLRDQQAAPLVPVYALLVYSLFFLVPVTLRVTQQPRA